MTKFVGYPASINEHRPSVTSFSKRYAHYPINNALVFCIVTASHFENFIYLSLVQSVFNFVFHYILRLAVSFQKLGNHAEISEQLKTACYDHTHHV